MVTTEEILDLDICPICKKPNECQHHCGGPDENSCWCHRLNIPKSVSDFIPEKFVGKVCLCRQCLIKLGATERRNPELCSETA